MMKKKKNDDDEEEEQGEQIIIIVGMCWETLNVSSMLKEKPLPHFFRAKLPSHQSKTSGEEGEVNTSEAKF